MMAKRKHNFNAGPSALPLPVLEQVQAELVDFGGHGLSIMEMSHRTPQFEEVLDRARHAVTRLYGIPATHEVLFLQGGASLQFAQVPMNLGSGGAYLDTGTWSKKALKEANTVGKGLSVWSSAAAGYNAVPAADEALDVPADAPYLHYTSNNTIYGTQYHYRPASPVPLVCDMSSDVLSRPADISKFGLIYAGAQKNAGPSGVTLLIIDRKYSREFHGAPTVPHILRYPTQAEKDSMYNTPNTFGIYVLALVAEWVEAQGGLTTMAARNANKAQMLYDLIDRYPGVFKGHAVKHSRSQMNVTFTLVKPERQADLLAAAAKADILGIKGHRSVGGLRASLYNAVSPESVHRLVEVLEAFAKG
ncbi:MAG: 3-phosphoserine/phosphohydroxythreonine transaminase [Myxococcales bacterium]|nr:3-phosphoserine/phosphohydroxythreonine transaminase [Myxococcales bacterium]